MNYDECVRQTIKESVGDVLEQMKSLRAEDRQALLLEHIENLYAWEDEEFLIVPRMEQEESK